VRSPPHTQAKATALEEERKAGRVAVGKIQQAWAEDRVEWEVCVCVYVCVCVLAHWACVMRASPEPCLET
jgi:hypothetical protein